MTYLNRLTHGLHRTAYIYDHCTGKFEHGQKGLKTHTVSFLWPEWPGLSFLHLGSHSVFGSGFSSSWGGHKGCPWHIRMFAGMPWDWTPGNFVRRQAPSTNSPALAMIWTIVMPSSCRVIRIRQYYWKVLHRRSLEIPMLLYTLYFNSRVQVTQDN